MMNKKRVRETIFNLVDHWCSEKPIYRANLPWIRGQISFAYMIEAITLSEKEELVKGCAAIVRRQRNEKNDNRKTSQRNEHDRTGT
ncbi:MAG: hypothetical protein LIP15_18150 [Clostridium sp.]|nr:hypothetical protein [Clostridium sp.]